MALLDSLPADLARGVDPLTPLLEVRQYVRADWPEAVQQQYLTGLQGGARALGESLRELVKRGASVHVLPQPDPTLVRVRVRQGGYNYIDLKFNDEQRLVDWYVYDLGEWFSESHARLSVLSADAATPVQRALFEHSDTVMALHAALRAQRWSAVLVSYWALPQVLQKDRSCLRLRVTAAMNLDETSYGEALAAYLKLAPDDPSGDLLAIDGWLLARRYDRSLAAIDRLEKRVGDPVLGNLRAGVLVRAGRVDEALQALETVADLVPADPDAHWAIIGLSLQRQDFERVASGLTRIVAHAGVTLRDLRPMVEYSAFLASMPGQRWLETQSQGS